MDDMYECVWIHSDEIYSLETRQQNQEHAGIRET